MHEAHDAFGRDRTAKRGINNRVYMCTTLNIEITAEKIRGLSSWWQLLDITTSTFYPQDGLRDAPVPWAGDKKTTIVTAQRTTVCVMSRFPNRWGTGGGESGL